MKNRSNSGSNDPPRQVRFAPKLHARKQPKLAVAKTELPASKDDLVDKELLAKVNRFKSQGDVGKKFKTEKKAVEDQVTFGYGTSTQTRSFGTPKAKTQSEDDSGFVSQPKEYSDPWDVIHSNYPVSLPSRRPYSGDPEVLDRLEFGEGGSAHLPIDENITTTAQKLGFMETDDEPKMIFLQLPCLPLVKPPHNKVADNKAADPSSQTGNLKDLPAGLMGKLLVYKSGKVNMKLGDVLFEVSPGIDVSFAEEIVAVNAKERHYCVLGELSKHAVVTPDVDSLLDDLNDSDA